MANPFVPPKFASDETVLAVTVAEQTEASQTGTPDSAGSLEWRGITLNSDALQPLTKLVDFINDSIGTVEKVATALKTIVSILEFFVSSFNSFSSIVNAAISYVQNAVNQWVEDLAGTGIFFTILVPPALRADLTEGKQWQKLSSGGFGRFLDSLSVSLFNKEDPNRPQFSDNARVGGFILLVDTESYDEFFRNLKTLSNFFDFMDLIPLLTEPPPPQNVKGVSGFDADQKFGVRMTWDAPTIRATHFRISRSEISGGRYVEQEAEPTKLNDWFRALNKRRRTGSWPTEVVRSYDEVGVVSANIISGKGEFIDYDIDEEKLLYYYVVEAGYVGEAGDALWGTRSPQVAVPIERKNCVDNNEAKDSQHGNGELELQGLGYGGLGSWGSLRAEFLLPFLPDLLKYFNKFANVLKGMTKSVDVAFGDFIDGIVEKFNRYKDMVELISLILERLLSLDFGTISWLFVPPEPGGTTGFINRVRTAQPEDDVSFSGPNGITAGVVIMFGAYNADIFGNSDPNVIESQVNALTKVFETFIEVLGGD